MCRRGPRLYFFPFRRFPARLAGCVTSASNSRNPGQSLPRSTGTGRSFTTPTSRGQVPGLAVTVIHRVGTFRVSPCMHVMGRRALTPTRGGNMEDCTKLPNSSSSGEMAALAPQPLVALSLRPAQWLPLGLLRIAGYAYPLPAEGVMVVHEGTGPRRHVLLLGQRWGSRRATSVVRGG